MKTRYLIFTLVSVLLLFSLQVMAQDDEIIEIEYWQYNFGARVDAMNQLIEQFEAEHPNIRIIHNSDIAYDNFRDEIAASAPAGVGPDVVSLFYGWIPSFVDAGYLVPLPEPFTEEYINETFVPMVAESAQFEGEYWAVPTAVRSLALFYNIDMLEAAGYDGPPETLEELVEMSQTLTIYDGEPAIETITQEGFPTSVAGQWHHWFREVLVRQFGGVPYSDDLRTVTWNSPEACEAFKYMAAFETEYLTGSNEIFGDADDAFVNGQAALHIDGSFRLGTIAANNPELNYGIAELPANADGERFTYGSYWTHGITRRAASDPARLEAATEFLQFITSPEAGQLWVEVTGELPAQIAAADPELLEDPIYGPFVKGLDYSYATFFVDETAQRQHLIDAFDLVRLSGLDACEALNETAAIEQDLLDEFWSGRDSE